MFCFGMSITFVQQFIYYLFLDLRSFLSQGKAMHQCIEQGMEIALVFIGIIAIDYFCVV